MTDRGKTVRTGIMKSVIAALLVGLCASQAQAQNIMATTPPHDGGMTWVTVTCASTSTPFAVGGGQYLTVQVPPSATQTVWFGWGGTVASPTTATTTTPSQGYAAGTNIAWGGGTGACIVASGTQVISVGYK